jgi:hypothetical protein
MKETAFARAEKILSDYRGQLGKPFEHEKRLGELPLKQDKLSRARDLDKGERQGAGRASESRKALTISLRLFGLRHANQPIYRAGDASTKGRRCGRDCDIFQSAADRHA